MKSGVPNFWLFLVNLRDSCYIRLLIISATMVGLDPFIGRRLQLIQSLVLTHDTMSCSIIVLSLVTFYAILV